MEKAPSSPSPLEPAGVYTRAGHLDNVLALHEEGTNCLLQVERTVEGTYEISGTTLTLTFPDGHDEVERSTPIRS